MSKISREKFVKIAITLIIAFAIWMVLDRVTKIYFDSGQFSLVQNITGSILGLFHFTLVHNTGAAFGIFGNATVVLGVISIVVSIVLLAMPFINAKMHNDKKTEFLFSTFQLILIAIIAAGGIGNAIDRLATGYVVDFICFDFIDFPVFNIADIGVTCGIIIIATILLYHSFSKR